MTPEQRRAAAAAKAKAQARLRLQEQQSGEGPGLGARTLDAAGDFARSFNTGLVTPFDPTGAGRQFLSDIPVLGDAFLAPGERNTTLTGEDRNILNAAGDVAGQSVSFGTGGALAAGTRTGQAGLQLLRRVPGVGRPVARVADDAAQFARRSPGTFAATEATAGGAAGAAGAATDQATEDSDLSDGARFAARLGSELTAGIAAAAAPGAAANLTRRGVEGVADTLFPITEGGGRIRAARQARRRTADPEAAAAAARNAPEGVTPARATGEARLLAQERRILDDNPELDAAVTADLRAAQDRVEREFQGQFGRPPTAKERETALMNLGAAPGARVEPGDTDEMLQQAFESFGVAYQGARGAEIDASGLGGRLQTAIRDPDLFAGEEQRSQVRGFLNNQLQNLRQNRLSENGTLSSGDLIDLRSLVRARIRSLSNTGDTGQQVREVLRNSERALTETLEEQLPADALSTLRATDQQFRKFKIIEDAVERSGEETLTQGAVSQSIRRNARSRGEFARGGDRELRQQALAQRPVEEVLGDPDAARRIARDLSPDQLQPIKADFADTLFRRSRAAGPDDGTQILSGEKLKNTLRDNREVAENLGFSSDEIARMDRIADELVTIQRKSPEAVTSLLTDGPATIMELGAALVGSKSGQRLAGSGLGASLVLANFLSNKARQTLATLTGAQAEKVMTRAVQDRELFAALLTQETASEQIKRQAARKVGGFLAAIANDEATNGEARPVEARQPGPVQAPRGPAGLLDDPNADPQRAPGLLQ